MKVKERMSPEPVTVGPETSVDDALGLMHRREVRHLPVVAEGKLVGLVNDGQLRGAWFPSLIEDLTVNDVMTADPLTVGVDDTVYQAARLLYHHKLTGLPVMDGESLAGIITLADVLGLFVSLLGLMIDSVRLDLALDEGQTLEEVHHLIRYQGGDVMSVALVSDAGGRRVYSFRLGKTDLPPIEESLAAAGYEVLS